MISRSQLPLRGTLALTQFGELLSTNISKDLGHRNVFAVTFSERHRKDEDAKESGTLSGRGYGVPDNPRYTGLTRP